jgi:hypothetical protein
VESVVVCGFSTDLLAVLGAGVGLLATIALTHLEQGERRFPLVRLGATIGWMAAGVMTSYLFHADTSPVAGYASAGVRLLGAGLAFLLPYTPPLGTASSWKSRLGLDAFSLLKQRDQGGVFRSDPVVFNPADGLLHVCAGVAKSAGGWPLDGDDDTGAGVGNRGDGDGGFGDGEIPRKDGFAMGDRLVGAALLAECLCGTEPFHFMALVGHRAAWGVLHILFHHGAGVSGPAGESWLEGQAQGL